MEGQTSRLAMARDFYLQAVDAVPDEAWNGRTLCEGWTPRHVVAHVAIGDQRIRGALFDAMGKSREGQDLPVDGADAKRRMEGLLTAPPAQLKDMARTESAQTVATILEAIDKSPQAVVPVAVGTMPVGALRALRLNEYVIHGHDLGPAVSREITAPGWFVERALADSVGMLPQLHRRSKRLGQSGTFHIHRTEGEGDWTVRVSDGQAAVEPGHGKADVAMRGSAEALYWLLMGRGTPSELGVEVHGDPAMAATFKEWFPGP